MQTYTPEWRTETRLPGNSHSWWDPTPDFQAQRKRVRLDGYAWLAADLPGPLKPAVCLCFLPGVLQVTALSMQLHDGSSTSKPALASLYFPPKGQTAAIISFGKFRLYLGQIVSATIVWLCHWNMKTAIDLCINEWVWPCSNKTLFMGTDNWPRGYSLSNPSSRICNLYREK